MTCLMNENSKKLHTSVILVHTLGTQIDKPVNSTISKYLTAWKGWDYEYELLISVYLEVSHVQDGHIALRCNAAAAHFLCERVWLKASEPLTGIREREQRADVQQGSERVHLQAGGGRGSGRV